MELKETLEMTGLSPNETRVYLTLLKEGTMKAGKLAKLSNINRTSAYDALKRLLEKGLVSYVVKANRKWYQSVHPRRLMEFLKEKEEDIEKILPQLEGLYKLPKEKQNVTLYYGLKGIKSVFQDIIREGNPNDVFGSEGQFVERMPYYAPHFVRALEQKKIKVRNIVRRGRDIKPSKTTEIRFVPKKVKSPVVTNIYGDKISIILWTDKPEAILIENKSAAETYRNYFELLWKIAKKK